MSVWKQTVHPWTDYEGPEGAKKYTSTPSLTSAVDGVVNVTPRLLYLRERDPVPTVQEVGWAQGPAGTCMENLAYHRDSIPRPSSP